MEQTDLVVLHIDRFHVTDHGELRKLHTVIHFCWSVMVPFFSQDTELAWTQYQIVAAFAHIGGIQSGHYQALLKTYPETSDLASPSMWLFCDDGTIPQRCLQIPKQFEEGVTCVWLCRSDQVDLHQLVPIAPVAQEDAILAMMSSMPTVGQHAQTDRA